MREMYVKVTYFLSAASSLSKTHLLTKYHSYISSCISDMDFNANFNPSHSCVKCRSRWLNSYTDLGYYSRCIHEQKLIHLWHIVPKIHGL